MRRLIWTILIVGLLALAAHDAWRFGAAERVLRNTTYEVTRWAGERAAEAPRDEVAREIAAQAAPRGVRIRGYEQTETFVKVWTEISVEETVLAATAANMVLGKSYSEARSTPFILTEFRQARFQ